MGSIALAQLRISARRANLCLTRQHKMNELATDDRDAGVELNERHRPLWLLTTGGP